MRWIDRIPLGMLTAIALLMAVLPWPREDVSHLVEKLGMLFDGTLIRPIDIFDLFLHGTPSALLIVRLLRMAMGKTAGKNPAASDADSASDNADG